MSCKATLPRVTMFVLLFHVVPRYFMLTTELDAGSRLPLPPKVVLPPKPELAIVLRYLAALMALGGIVLFVLCWPRHAEGGAEGQIFTFLPALTWLISGLISGCLFFSMAEILIYLSQISYFSRWSVSFSRAYWQASPPA